MRTPVRRPLPDHLPIVSERIRRGDYRPVYEERELESSADLCDATGRLDPPAVGWSRTALVRANLRGHWPRRKRWNFWNNMTSVGGHVVWWDSAVVLTFRFRYPRLARAIQRSAAEASQVRPRAA
jgi:hypothetical protein